MINLLLLTLGIIVVSGLVGVEIIKRISKTHTHIFALYTHDNPKNSKIRLGWYNGSDSLYTTIIETKEPTEQIPNSALQELYHVFKIIGEEHLGLKEGDVVLAPKEDLGIPIKDGNLVALEQINPETGELYYALKKVLWVYDGYDEPENYRYILSKSGQDLEDEQTKEDIKENYIDFDHMFLGPEEEPSEPNYEEDNIIIADDDKIITVERFQIVGPLLLKTIRK